MIVFDRTGGPAMADKTCRRLIPGPSQRIRNHSPDGFEWGYGGSGPAQLALAILLDYFGGLPVDRRPQMETAPRLAEQLYQEFKFDVIAGLPKNFWQIEESEIAMWIEARESAKTYFRAKFDGARSEGL